MSTIPAHILTAAHILTLRTRDEHDGLIVNHRSWSEEASNSEGVAEALATDDPGALYEALGTPEEVTLTGDGRSADPKSWCLCVRVLEPVRYERWTAEGRVAHGYVCPKVVCRRLVQSG